MVKITATRILTSINGKAAKKNIRNTFMTKDGISSSTMVSIVLPMAKKSRIEPVSVEEISGDNSLME